MYVHLLIHRYELEAGSSILTMRKLSPSR